eukprot:2872267-Alexandrium_andersonii.AAC.1
MAFQVCFAEPSGHCHRGVSRSRRRVQAPLRMSSLPPLRIARLRLRSDCICGTVGTRPGHPDGGLRRG